MISSRVTVIACSGSTTAVRCRRRKPGRDSSTCKSSAALMVRFSLMSRTPWAGWRGVVPTSAFALVAGLAACSGGGSSSPSAPSTPSPSTVSVSGGWSGTATDSSGPGRMTWQLAQSGSTLTGTLTMTDDATGVTGRGSVAGTVTGATIQFSVNVLAGGFDGDYAACTAAVSGSGSASATAITASYTGSNSCNGAVASGQLNLSKQ